MLILAIDQGTTNTKALVFDESGRIVAEASAGCRTDHPHPAWAEQSAAEIWDTTRAVIARAATGLEDGIAAIGIANQRETLVVWDAETSEPVGPAPLWQCRRTAAACDGLIAAGHADEVAELTGLGINPLFPATKLAWVLEHRPEAARLHALERLRAGTVDAWLLWNLTGGAAFATDHSNASRTLLLDTRTLDWSPRLAEIFGVPLDVLPQPLASDACFGVTAEGATALPPGVPIHAIMGDSHAALFGHGVTGPGTLKATYGTGSSLMTLTEGRPSSRHGVSSTVGWSAGGRTFHALEGNITVSGQAAAFGAELLGLRDAAALSELAQTVEDSGGVSFVPALAGLGAPHWDDRARGLVSGLTLGSRPAHVARATFEAIAHQVADVFHAMEEDLGRRIDTLGADGGASGNAFLMQVQADLLGRTVVRSALAEIGALGVARMAAEAIGGCIATAEGDATVFAPALGEDARARLRDQWRAAVARARSGS